MLEPKRYSDNSYAKDCTKYQMSGCYPQTSCQEPQNIHEYIQTS